MTIQQVIDKIIAYHPDLGERLATTCDTVKYGDTSRECTGVATAIYPSPDVIPVSYTHLDVYKRQISTPESPPANSFVLCPASPFFTRGTCRFLL